MVRLDIIFELKQNFIADSIFSLSKIYLVYFIPSITTTTTYITLTITYIIISIIILNFLSVNQIM